LTELQSNNNNIIYPFNILIEFISTCYNIFLYEETAQELNKNIENMLEKRDEQYINLKVMQSEIKFNESMVRYMRKNSLNTSKTLSNTNGFGNAVVKKHSESKLKKSTTEFICSENYFEIRKKTMSNINLRRIENMSSLSLKSNYSLCEEEDDKDIKKISPSLKTILPDKKTNYSKQIISVENIDNYVKLNTECNVKTNEFRKNSKKTTFQKQNQEIDKKDNSSINLKVNVNANKNEKNKKNAQKKILNSSGKNENPIKIKSIKQNTKRLKSVEKNVDTKKENKNNNSILVENTNEVFSNSKNFLNNKDEIFSENEIFPKTTLNNNQTKGNNFHLQTMSDLIDNQNENLIMSPMNRLEIKSSKLISEKRKNEINNLKFDKTVIKNHTGCCVSCV